jgi:zinc D-Ala-D-Ala dipeptidase
MRSLKWFAPIPLTAMALASPAGAQALPGGFVFLRDIDPSILQDIRYAGAEQFRRPQA